MEVITPSFGGLFWLILAVGLGIILFFLTRNSSKNK